MINKFNIIAMMLCFFLPNLVLGENFISKQISLLEKHKQKLSKNIESFEKLPKISCKKVKIALEDCFSELPLVTRKMFLKGFYGSEKYPDEEEFVFEKRHQSLIKRFQKSHFIKESGIFDQKTCQLLNQSIKYDISLITKNILRLKKIEHHHLMNEKAIFVNVPQYKLWTIEKFGSVDTMRIISGRYAMKTPIRHEMMYAVDVNPKWVIPPTVLRNKLPSFSKNPEMLDKKDIRVFDKERNIILPDEIDWDHVKKNQHLYRFEQAPGGKNVLGQLRFLLRNNESIYLHGTNLPKLFNNKSRALSSGCIRVQKPQKLAAWIIEDHINNNKCNKYDDDSSDEFSACMKQLVQGKIDTEISKQIKLSREIPVFLEYISTWIHEDGMLYISDPYKMDTV